MLWPVRYNKKSTDVITVPIVSTFVTIKRLALPPVVVVVASVVVRFLISATV